MQLKRLSSQTNNLSIRVSGIRSRINFRIVNVNDQFIFIPLTKEVETINLTKYVINLLPNKLIKNLSQKKTLLTIYISKLTNIKKTKLAFNNRTISKMISCNLFQKFHRPNINRVII